MRGAPAFIGWFWPMQGRDCRPDGNEHNFTIIATEEYWPAYIQNAYASMDNVPYLITSYSQWRIQLWADRAPPSFPIGQNLRLVVVVVAAQSSLPQTTGQVFVEMLKF